MTKTYLSPGTYIEQRDRSQLPSIPIDIGGVFIGGFAKGKALVPQYISDESDLILKMGQPNGMYYSCYGAKDYSKIRGDFYVQRILWEDGYKSNGVIITVSGSDSEVPYALLLSTQTGSGDHVNALTIPGEVTKCQGVDGVLSFGTSNAYGTTTTVSLSYGQILNLESNLNLNPITNTTTYYLAEFYGYQDDIGTETLTFSAKIFEDVIDTYDTVSQRKFRNAETPWIRNESGEKLFRFKTISDGTVSNRMCKVSLKNFKISASTGWTSFDVLIRSYIDTDKRPEIIQSYFGVNLNPESINYLPFVIGDQYSYYDQTSKRVIKQGDFQNRSKRIYVQVSDAVKQMSIAPSTIPNYIDAQTFYKAGYQGQIAQTPRHSPITSSVGLENYEYMFFRSELDMNWITTPYSDNKDEVDEHIKLNADLADLRYTLPFHSGFDGKNPAIPLTTNDNFLTGFDMTTQDSGGTKEYKKAINILANKDEYNIKYISAPGINLQNENGKYHVFEYILQICEERGDIFFPGDLAELTNKNVDSVLSLTQFVDSSFGSVYYPAVKIRDASNRAIVTLPSSTYIPSVLAYTEIVTQPFYAPAGVNRGVLNVLEPVFKLNQTDRDKLYRAKINPITFFTGYGTVIWGQKTLQTMTSALDRINVRLLLNTIKRWIEGYGKVALFDNNTSTLRSIFTNNVQAFLDNIVKLNGLYDYRFQMDDLNNLGDILDRNQLVGQVWIKPSKTSEFLIIPINILRTSDQI